MQLSVSALGKATPRGHNPAFLTLRRRPRRTRCSAITNAAPDGPFVGHLFAISFHTRGNWVAKCGWPVKPMKHLNPLLVNFIVPSAKGIFLFSGEIAL